MRYHWKWTVTGLICLVAACGSSSAAGPQAKTIAQHEAAAAAEEGQASSYCQGGNEATCSSDRANSEAKKLREMAVHHRAAAKALRDAEERACEGMSAKDRDKSPFLRGAEIRSVSQLRGMFGEAGEDFAGATIVFRAEPGVTAEWLQRVVDCHLARDAAVGSDTSEMAMCPLAIPGVGATVASFADGFAVEVLSDNDATAAEIWRRAQRIPVRP